jgi:hypothetical protein
MRKAKKEQPGCYALLTTGFVASRRLLGEHRTAHLLFSCFQASVRALPG